MSLWEMVFAAVLIVAGFGAVWCTVVSLVCDLRARRREAAQDAPPPQAMPNPAGRVSADEIQFFASLTRMEEELNLITEGGYRLPGECAS